MPTSPFLLLEVVNYQVVEHRIHGKRQFVTLICRSLQYRNEKGEES